MGLTRTEVQSVYSCISPGTPFSLLNIMLYSSANFNWPLWTRRRRNESKLDWAEDTYSNICLRFQSAIISVPYRPDLIQTGPKCSFRGRGYPYRCISVHLPTSVCYITAHRIKQIRIYRKWQVLKISVTF